MSMFTLSEGEKWVQCPYNKAHMITDTRILHHLDKCRRNHEKEMASQGKTVEFAICRYNSLHQVHKVELDYHHQNCRDQYKIVEHLKCQGIDHPKSLGKRKLPIKTEDDVDNLEADATVKVEKKPKCYQSVKLQQDGILFIPPGLTKAERKAYQKEQMKRLQQKAEEELEEFEGEEEEYYDEDEEEYEEESDEGEKKVKDPSSSHIVSDKSIKRELQD